MARWFLVLALLSGPAFAQGAPSSAPMTAADAVALARGGSGPSAPAASSANGAVVDPDAASPTPGAMPSRQQVQQAQDHCPPGEPDCAKKQRETPAPPTASATQSPLNPVGSQEPAPGTVGGDEPGLFGSTLVGVGSPALNAPGGLAGAAKVPTHPIEFSAYAILGGEWTQQDPNYLYVGRNNGFYMQDARIELTGRPLDNLWLFLSVDGAQSNPSATDPTQGTRTVALKDAYGVYSPGFHIRIEAGQFKAPQDVEHLLEETEIKFPTRSLLTAGLHAPEGYETAGLSLQRQIGIALGTDVIPLPFGSIAAQVMVSNGNGSNTLFNSTSIPGVIGRVALGLFGIVSLGADGYFMPQATGTQPDLFRDDWTGAGGDIRVEWRGIHVMGLLQWRNTAHLTTGAPSEQALGYTIEGAYRLPGWFHFLEPAVRYGMLNPSNKITDANGDEIEQVESLDVALNVYAPNTNAARLSVSYVHRMEDPSRTLQNDGVDMSLQVSF